MSDPPLRRVAIIGGGASGWAAAEALNAPRWKGAFEVTVYERRDYFGGKCCTVSPDGLICNGATGGYEGRGYEVGGSVVSKGSWSNADLERLLQAHDIPYSDAAEARRKKYAFYANGRRIGAGHIAWWLLRHPLRVLRALWGLRRYWRDLRRYSTPPSLDYSGRPAALHRPLSQVFSNDLNRCVGFGMQGFGYADLADATLTPPMLYYHQYGSKDVIVNPVYTVDIGMQGVWARIAATYPAERARLGDEVLSVKRQENGVEVHARSGREMYDYLVVAVPLSPAMPFLDLDDREATLLERVRTNHYVSVLCRVDGLCATGSVNVANTVDRSNLGGVMFAYQRYPDSDWVSVNLLLDPHAPLSDSAIVDAVERDLARGFGAQLLERGRARVYHWPDYFPHLGSDDLGAGWYDVFENEVQGSRRTLWVSSGLHMETVGASVQYATAKVNEYAPRWLKSRRHSETHGTSER